MANQENERNGSETQQNAVLVGVAGPAPDRSSFTTIDSVAYLWKGMGLPEVALESIAFKEEGLGLPSSFKTGHIAQASIGTSALAAALIYSLRDGTKVPQVSVPLKHACAEFHSERLYELPGFGYKNPWAIGGLHKTSDGMIRIHDSFPSHRFGALALLGLDKDASKSDVSRKLQGWAAIDAEREAHRTNIVIAALRSYKQWDALPQAKAVMNFPIKLKKLAPGSKGLSPRTSAGAEKCLHGLRVVEMSRVIAAPVAGRTLAAHGADVIWVSV